MSNNRALEMFQSGQGADCVIEVVPEIDGTEKQVFNVHKYVLMVNSDVFMAMFSHENTKEAREGRIVIEDSTAAAVRQMLIYMYTGKVTVKDYAIETDALPLMAIADKYLMKPLVDFYAESMVQNSQKSIAFFAKKNTQREITEFWKNYVSSRALEMLQTGEGADCLIEVVHQPADGLANKQQEEKEFNVHKYVLMVNSDVFMAMFSHENTKEAREGRIQITNSTGAAVRQMLFFMYTGELPTEYATLLSRDYFDNSAEYAIEKDAGPLMNIAHKYQIQSLVQLIEQELINSLSLGNVFDRLELADLYQIPSLYSACRQLIRRHQKMMKRVPNGWS